MKKIKHYTGDPLAFYTDVRDSKRDVALKTSLRTIHPKMETLYRVYNDAFSHRQLHTLISDNSLTDVQRTHLASLYNYHAAPFKHLMNELTTNEYDQQDKTCPFCTINSASTFDHILPKSVFDEYAVHPLNLIPCCAECNGHKSDEWAKTDALKFLNLYQDELPNEQYLYVDLTVVNGMIKARFFVQNRGNIDLGLYERIEDTYTIMQLCRRFQERCADELYELALSIQSALVAGSSVERIKTSILRDADRLRQRKGYNYWKAVLKEACCTDDDAFLCLMNMR